MAILLFQLGQSNREGCLFQQYDQLAPILAANQINMAPLRVHIRSHSAQVVFLEIHGIFDQNSSTNPAPADHPQVRLSDGPLIYWLISVMKFLKFIVTCISVLLLCPLLAQAKAVDVLVMKNGDRITGEITKIWDEEITIEPEYSDEFNVDVPGVAYIESEREFEIDLADGRELVVTFPGADAEGNQIIKTGSGTEVLVLSNMLELDEPEDYFDWESFIDLSGDLKRGNTDSSNNKLRADTTLKLGDHRHIGEFVLYREKLADETTKDQTIVNYNYAWFFKDPWFFSAFTSFERDPIIQLDSRVTVSAGVGLEVWNTADRSLNIQLGVGARDEDIGDQSETSSVATWVLRYSQDFFSDDLTLFHNHSIIPTISGRTNTSIRTSTGLRYEITDLLYANISLDYDYETEPADAATDNEDIVLLFGLGLEF
jgi:putative salt-induced outer membrane protein YdiY